MVSERLGPFDLGAPQSQWGAGFYAGLTKTVDDDDLPPRVLMRASSPGEALAVALEGAWRARNPHPRLPSLLRRGEVYDTGRAWLAFAPVVAVPLELLLDQVIPVELALSWTRELVSVMDHHAAHPPPSPPGTTPVVEPLRPGFGDLLVAREGALVVKATPAAGRTQRPGLLRQAARDRLLLAPELVAGDRFDAAGVDVFVAGALLRELLRDPALGADEPRDDVPLRIEALVRRATTAADERFESLAELEEELARCLDDHPPVEDDDRAAFVRTRLAIDLDRAEASLLR